VPVTIWSPNTHTILIGQVERVGFGDTKRVVELTRLAQVSQHVEGSVGGVILGNDRVSQPLTLDVSKQVVLRACGVGSHW